MSWGLAPRLSDRTPLSMQVNRRRFLMTAAATAGSLGWPHPLKVMFPGTSETKRAGSCQRCSSSCFNSIELAINVDPHRSGYFLAGDRVSSSNMICAYSVVKYISIAWIARHLSAATVRTDSRLSCQRNILFCIDARLLARQNNCPFW